MSDTRQPSRGMKDRTPAQWSVVGIVLALVAAVAVYGITHNQGLDQTSALFIGLPAVLAIALTLTPRAKSATGMALKALTIGLLLSAILLREGVICILLAAPLFYGVALAITIPIDRQRRRGKEEANEGRLYSLVLPIALLLSLEGVTPLTTLPTHGTASAVETLNATPEQVAASVAQTPQFRRPLPLFLQLPFPHPMGSSGSGVALGDRRTVVFSINGHRFEAVFEVVRADNHHVRFHLVSDKSPIARWFRWRDADVEWHAASGGRTLVTCSISYDRRLSPAWYFGPLEQLAAQSSADYLIQVMAMPE
ncbi:MAG: hypothetical protein M3Z11_07620 [Candidatus Dormibacteraeota bacterium]|nr:hypothetical protein [Candidatus Dormibacteraeota bacterium]